MRVTLPIAAVTFLGAASIVFACSSFTSEDAPTSGSDAAAPDSSADDAMNGAPPDASNPDADADAAAPADLGCKNPTVTADFAGQLDPAVFTPSLLMTSLFVTMKEDGGTYGRFTLPPLSDGGRPDQHLYFVSVPADATRFCVSARIRVMQPPPSGAKVVDLASVLHDDDGGSGVGGAQLFGNQTAFFAGVTSSASNAAIGIVGTDWHVVQLDFEGVGNVWRTVSLTFDGAHYLVGTTTITPGAKFRGADVGLGLNPQSDLAAGAQPIVVDYADFRFSQH